MPRLNAFKVKIIRSRFKDGRCVNCNTSEHVKDLGLSRSGNSRCLKCCKCGGMGYSDANAELNKVSQKKANRG